MERTCLQSLFDKQYIEELYKINARHNTKLLNMWHKQGKKSPECVVNSSHKKLSAHEMDALQYGLKHHILPRSFEHDKIKINIERALNDVTWRTSSKVDFQLKEDIRNVYYKFYNESKMLFKSKKHRAYHNTLRNLAEDESRKVCSFDKGTGVVVMNSEDYFSKLDIIVNDPSKFKKLIIDDDVAKANLIISKQRSVKYYVDTYFKDNNGFDKKTRDSLTPSGCQPGKLYELCKVHKEGHPMRPVVSMIGTPEYHLAKFLDGFIKPNIPKDFMLTSTSQFIDKLQLYSPQGDETMVSFDVSSLFTNVPLMETIDIVISRLYSEDAVITPPIKKEIFRKMLVLCSQGMFVYNNDWYEQIDGVAMGSPLAPSLANMFLAHIECQLLLNKSTYPSNFPKLYLRYVDDTFCLFECQ